MNDRMRQARQRADLTALALAEQARTTEGRVYAIERGRYPPHPDEAERIADVLGVRVETLFPMVKK